LHSDPKRADELLALAQADADERWRHYTQLAGLERSVVEAAAKPDPEGQS